MRECGRLFLSYFKQKVTFSNQVSDKHGIFHYMVENADTTREKEVTTEDMEAA